jgi:hypothetical protein
MSAALAEFRSVLRLHRAQLAGLMEKRGVGKMQRLYRDAEAEVSRKLRELVRRGRGDTFTAHHYRMVLVQVRDGVHQFEQNLAAHMGREGRTAGLLAHRHLIKEVKAASKTFAGHTPVLRAEQAAVAKGVFNQEEPSLLRRFQSSVRLYGPPTIKKVEGQMALAMTSGENVGEAIDRVTTAIAGERWRAERIVRTEMSYSYGVVKQASMEGLRTELPRLQKKLVATHDDRTGADSLQLDGQTVEVNHPFVWQVKNAKGIPTGEVKRYMQPPNRPNDREIVIPWRPEWGGGGIGEQGAVAPAEL